MRLTKTQRQGLLAVAHRGSAFLGRETFVGASTTTIKTGTARMLERLDAVKIDGTEVTLTEAGTAEVVLLNTRGAIR